MSQIIGKTYIRNTVHISMWSSGNGIASLEQKSYGSGLLFAVFSFSEKVFQLSVPGSYAICIFFKICPR